MAQEVRGVHRSGLRQAKGSGNRLLLRGFLRDLLVPLHHFGADAGADAGAGPGFGPRCPGEDSRRGLVGVVGL